MTDAGLAGADMPREGAKSDGRAGRAYQAPDAPRGPNAALKEAAPREGDGYAHDHPLAQRLVVADRAAGRLAMRDPLLPRPRKIAICGFAGSTRHYIAQITDDPEWEIWGLNQFYRHCPNGPEKRGGRADVWWDIHWNWDKEIVPGTDHRKWAQECGIPFYMQTPLEDIPTAARYPLEALLQHFGSDYFTSTIAYMLALATYEHDLRARAELNAAVERFARERAAGTGPEALDIESVREAIYGRYEIAVFGVDLSVESEYFREKPCAEFWIGQAAARGIQVRIPTESALCKQGVRYGYDAEPSALVRQEEIEKHQARLRAERDELLKRAYMIEGAIECDEKWRQTIELRKRGSVVVAV